MPQHVCSRGLVLLIAALVGFGPDAGVQAEPGAGSRTPPGISADRLDRPGGVYARIPARDEYGRDQLAMFSVWNPDPVGNHTANLQSLSPMLAKVVRKAQVENPDLRFVIGSGRRDEKLQRQALAWGWSRTRGSLHRSGDAVDLWPLDPEGHVYFDRLAQDRIAAVLKKAAAELGVPIRWGGYFHSFKNMDRSHFELVPQ
jgi:peptidoglycan LD-endopeptidase CwlK